MGSCTVIAVRCREYTLEARPVLSTATPNANRHWSNAGGVSAVRRRRKGVDPGRDVGDLAAPRPDGGVVTQRTANPCTPVRFRLGPPAAKASCGPGARPVTAMPSAALAQSVEHIIRNDGVRCSSHLSGTTLSAGKSKGLGGRAFRLGPGLGPVWGALGRESGSTHAIPRKAVSKCL